MPFHSLRRALRSIGVAVVPAVAASMIAEASAAAQFDPRLSTSSSVEIRVRIPAVLVVDGSTVVRTDASQGYVLITERVHVSGNIAHRLVVRYSGVEAAVRLRGGVWAPVVAGATVAVAETQLIGETTHLVVCRRPASPKVSVAGCGFAFELESMDPAFPTTSSRYAAAR